MPDTTPMAKETAKDLCPESGQPVQMFPPGQTPPDQKRGDERRQPNREAWKDNVKGDCKSKLDPGQQDGIDIHWISLLL